MFRLPFADRVEAGRFLAKELASRKIGLDSDAVVLALTRGGVPVGSAVADRLHLPLEPLVVRKLGVPWQPELAMGAVTGSARVLDIPMIRQLDISEAEVEDVIEREQAEVRHREGLFRGDLPPLELHGQTVILVDDGLATGSTMRAAIQHVRRLSPAGVIVAVPVGSKEACNELRLEADRLVCLETPEQFISVGQFYRDFEQVTDEEVCHLVAVSRRQRQKQPRSAATA